MRALATYPALAAVRMPRSAVIVAVHAKESGDQAPALVVEYDANDQETVERHFVTLSCAKGAPIPAGAGYVSSWRRHPADGGLAALYERVDADVPADLDPERHADYRLLAREGYKPVQALEPGDPGRMTCWKAPDDQPPGGMSLDAMQAIARLQEHGYGPVVE